MSMMKEFCPDLGFHPYLWFALHRIDITPPNDPIFASAFNAGVDAIVRLIWEHTDHGIDVNADNYVEATAGAIESFRASCTDL
jgi:hypothetical protein